MKILVGISLIILFTSFKTESRNTIDDLCELVGYTCIDCSNVVGDFEGADFEKLVKLDNGMIFEFNEYNYSYSYRPEVAIFAMERNYKGESHIMYKLVIEDEIYDCFRLR